MGQGSGKPRTSPSEATSIDSNLYDCDVLFPADLSCHYNDVPVAKETRHWLRISAVTMSAVGAMARIWMKGVHLRLEWLGISPSLTNTVFLSF